MARRRATYSVGGHGEPKSLVDHTKEVLAQAIISGELPPGYQIKEEEIAGRLGISRPPLREALRALEAEGLVVRKPRRGAFVSEISERDVWEIYTLKMALYGLATRLAMGKMSLRVLRKLRRAVERMEGCLEKAPPDLARYQLYHQEFHSLLMEAAGNERLRRMSESLHNQVKRFSYRSLLHEEHLRSSCNYHRRILEAIEVGDGPKAELLTQEHVWEALSFLTRTLAQDGPLGGLKGDDFSACASLKKDTWMECYKRKRGEVPDGGYHGRIPEAQDL